MDNFELSGDAHNPSIRMDAGTGELEFSGMSRPEDVSKVYNPIIDWLVEYGKNPQAKTKANFRFDYFNTASAKVLYELMAALDDIHLSGNEVEINWYYEEPDIDMQGAGEEFNDLIETEINLISESR